MACMMRRSPWPCSMQEKTLQMAKATHASGRKNHPLTSVFYVGFGRRNTTLRRIRLHRRSDAKERRSKSGVEASIIRRNCGGNVGGGGGNFIS